MGSDSAYGEPFYKEEHKMREILFRGKRVSGCGWLVSQTLWNANGNIFLRDDRGKWIHVVSETVGQYTGYEVGGKRLFEGDIVRLDYEPAWDEEVGEYRYSQTAWGAVVFEMNDFEKNMYQEIRMLREKFSILKLENAKLKAQLTWRPVSELPEEDQIVIATYVNSYGKRRRVSAVYVRQYEEEAGDDDELCVEYCEEKDELYLKEGWYELIDNWDYSSAAIVEGVVDYWMPMPPAPDTVSDGWEEK